MKALSTGFCSGTGQEGMPLPSEKNALWQSECTGALRFQNMNFQVIFGFALSCFVHPSCGCNISAAIHGQHLTKLPVCTFSNYFAFYFKLASFWHLITKPTLHFRMGNSSQVFSWSQWGRFILHFTYIYWPISVSDSILTPQFYCKFKF